MAIPHTHTIATERLLLRAFTPEAQDALFTGCTDEEIMQFLNLQTAEALEAEKERYTAGTKTWRTSFMNFHLLEKATGNMIGSCGFHTWYLQHQRAEIGYAMNSDAYKQQGYMKEAIMAIVDYGFEEMKLNRIEAFIGPQNEASIRLVTGLGFVYEGLLRGHYCKNGEIQDSAVYGLLRDEYYAL